MRTILNICRDGIRKRARGKAIKGKGKLKGKDDPKSPKCYYCDKVGHKKEECRKRAADLKKAMAEGKPSVINELSEATGQLSSSGGSQRLEALLSRPLSPQSEVVYIWACVDKAVQKEMLVNGLVLLDSGAAVSACPRD